MKREVKKGYPNDRIMNVKIIVCLFRSNFLLVEWYPAAPPTPSKKRKKEKSIMMNFRFLTATKSLFCTRSVLPAHTDYHLLVIERYFQTVNSLVFWKVVFKYFQMVD